jgi:poly(3-hydroxybutyrate) depolymerase
VVTRTRKIVGGAFLVLLGLPACGVDATGEMWAFFREHTLARN